MFSVHARLLERAGNFCTPRGTHVSITCLPVAELVEGDLSGHINTNLMGITDGHIFFDSMLFEKGKRPAINVFLSVTRVGRQTQDFLFKDINQKVTSLLAEYESLQRLSHFGAELSQELQNKIRKGERLSEIFEQDLNITIEETTQLTLIALVWGDLLNEFSVADIKQKLMKHHAKKIPPCDTIEQLINEVSKQKDDIAKLLC
jgi:F-type H+-transporting ATPase subunit alpha